MPDDPRIVSVLGKPTAWAAWCPASDVARCFGGLSSLFPRVTVRFRRKIKCAPSNAGLATGRLLPGDGQTGRRQDTGLRQRLPTGRGPFRFSTMDEALAAIDKINHRLPTTLSSCSLDRGRVF